MKKNYEFWFVVGSQFLYGPEVLETVAARAAEMAEALTRALPYPVVYKVTAKTNAEITEVVKEANYDDKCAGIIAWCHTFSPSKMWINGLSLLQKPYCHLATQYNREIPNEEIDMDFMNLNQAAHGDREHGFIGARLRMPRKIIAGYWQDEKVHKRLADWMKAAVGVAFSNTFQDLYGMKQLPGLASQHLMAQGYGYGGEGDWKVSAMTAIMKAMGECGNGASAFMEDYTYHLVQGQEYSLGAHILEVCPSVAADRPRIEVHPLGIGNREDPARLVFEGKAGKAIVVSLIDMGGRLRLICQDIEAVKPILPMPNLPVARVMWKAMPDLTTGVECWITAGGAHHTVLSYDVTAEQMRDWARMMDIEFVHIDANTTQEDLERELLVNDLVWKLK